MTRNGPPPSTDSGQRGMILMVVLWAVTLMTVIVIALSALGQKSLTVASSETDLQRSRLALEAGLAVGVAMIIATRSELRILLDGTPQTADIGGGRTVELRIRDAAGLVDLNRADEHVIEALVNSAGIRPDEGAALLTAIMNGRGNDTPKAKPEDQAEQQTTSQPGLGGATTTPAQGTQPEDGDRPPAPALFSFGQLYGITGISSASLAKLLPLVTLYSATGKVNPLAAPDQVLGAIPALRATDRKIIADARRLRQPASPQMAALIARPDAQLTVDEPRTFVIDIKLNGGSGLIAGRRMSATIILDSEASVPFQVLAWSW